MDIRTANPCDAAAISRLMAQLGYDASANLIGAKLDAFSQSADDAVFVAEAKDHIIGCLSANDHDLFHMEGRLGRITSLVVDVEARGMGAGRALVDRTKAHFQDRGCVRIEVRSGNHRLEAHAFYRSVGFVEDERRFILKL
jgi:ribosomal protein S18 acetylase RimI-like enzyme